MRTKDIQYIRKTLQGYNYKLIEIECEKIVYSIGENSIIFEPNKQKKEYDVRIIFNYESKEHSKPAYINRFLLIPINKQLKYFNKRLKRK